MKRILIIGATSTIASACARLWAQQGAHLFLVGRNTTKLAALAADLLIRGAASVQVWQLNVVEVAAHASMLTAAKQALGEIDIVLIAYGTLPDQRACEGDVPLTIQAFTTNSISVIALLTVLANQLEQQRHGAIGVITSVAGERGRPSNYIYGSAKAAVSVFCEGLRARLFKSGVTLTDIRPGFVATAMTQALSLPSLLVAQPQTVAQKIVSGLAQKVDILYTPFYWRIIMTIIRNIPRPIFKRMPL